MLLSHRRNNGSECLSCRKEVPPDCLRVHTHDLCDFLDRLISDFFHHEQGAFPCGEPGKTADCKNSLAALILCWQSIVIRN